MGGLIQLSNFPKLIPYVEMFRNGLIITIMLSLCTVVLGAVLGVVLALMRLSDLRPFRALGLDKYGHLRGEGFLTALSKFNPLNFLATTYVEILRSTPVIVQIAVIYYGIFGIIELPTFSLFGITKFHRFFPGVVALGMNSAAYLCEIIRSGIQSIDGGQTEAARSLGLSQTQTMRFVVLPQAIRNILPAIANEFVVIIKESAVTYTIGVQDIMAIVQSVKGATYLIMEPLLVATAMYFCLCFPTSKIIAYFERRMSRGSKR
ncbi:MAG: amino acid ABC transporter permease [Ruminococcaceae bacterium]|nr:amino acid ABC transporter permease [Oscillospiraceae bacterium]